MRTLNEILSRLEAAAVNYENMRMDSEKTDSALYFGHQVSLLEWVLGREPMLHRGAIAPSKTQQEVHLTMGKPGDERCISVKAFETGIDIVPADADCLLGYSVTVSPRVTEQCCCERISVTPKRIVTIP